MTTVAFPTIEDITFHVGTSVEEASQRALTTADGATSYTNYREMLDSEKLDVVLFCSEIAGHAEIAEALAEPRIHIITEKPMAAILPDALRMVRAARRADVALLVNWPITWRPWVRVVKNLIEGGEIGDVWKFKWRNGPSLVPSRWVTDIRSAASGKSKLVETSQGSVG